MYNCRYIHIYNVLLRHWRFTKVETIEVSNYSGPLVADYLNERLNSFQLRRCELLCIFCKHPQGAPKLPGRHRLLAQLQAGTRFFQGLCTAKACLGISLLWKGNVFLPQHFLMSRDSGRCLKQASTRTPLNSSSSYVCNVFSYFVVNMCRYKTF